MSLLPEDAVSVDAAIHRAVMEKDLADLDDGLETVVGPRGVKLSGGQVQRAAAPRPLRHVRRPVTRQRGHPPDATEGLSTSASVRSSSSPGTTSRSPCPTR